GSGSGSGSNGESGHRKGKPKHGHSNDKSSEGPIDRKLDDLEDLSRRLRRDGARRRATGHPADPDRDW
ncbi:MAG TPA: hypothetical protein VGF94_02180, partial [Kofleriaceae bacterium]